MHFFKYIYYARNYVWKRDVLPLCWRSGIFQTYILKSSDPDTTYCKLIAPQATNDTAALTPHTHTLHKYVRAKSKLNMQHIHSYASDFIYTLSTSSFCPMKQPDFIVTEFL